MESNDDLETLRTHSVAFTVSKKWLGPILKEFSEDVDYCYRMVRDEPGLCEKIFYLASAADAIQGVHPSTDRRNLLFPDVSVKPS